MDEIDTEIYQESERIFGQGSPLLAHGAVRCDRCGFKTGPCLWDIREGWALCRKCWIESESKKRHDKKPDLNLEDFARL